MKNVELGFEECVGVCVLGEGAQAAEESLKRLGAKEDVNIGYGASWAFAGFKGDHSSKEWVAEVTRPRYQGPSMISNMINTPAADKGFSISFRF